MLQFGQVQSSAINQYLQLMMWLYGPQLDFSLQGSKKHLQSTWRAKGYYYLLCAELSGLLVLPAQRTGSKLARTKPGQEPTPLGRNGKQGLGVYPVHFP